MIGIELVKDKTTREPAPALRNRVETPGIRTRPDDSRLRRDLNPPLPTTVVSEEEATVALDILEDCLTQVEKESVATRELASVNG